MAGEEIWIIGTEPPCPRCDYLTKMVTDVVATLGFTVPVKHLAYTSEEAREYAASLGLEPGTAKDVARKAAVDVDWNRVHDLVDGPNPEPACCPSAATQWTPALDEALRSCEEMAASAGILMTPVLVMGGRLVHQGSVPERGKVTDWVKGFFPEEANRFVGRHIVEVLGPGCDKCNTLHDNVIQAVDRSGFGDRITVRKRTDISYFQEMGVFITPGLVIDGTVVSKGKVMTVDQVTDYLTDHLPVDTKTTSPPWE